MPGPPDPRRLLRHLGGAVVPGFVRLTHAADADPGPQRPLPLWPTGPGGYTFAHINVVIPDLPDPHRYLACMVLMGQTGTRLFDDDRAVQGSPANTATTTIGTAATPDGYRAHDLSTSPNRAEWRLGDSFALEGDRGEYHVVMRESGLDVDLSVATAGPVTWFARSPIYDHVGYPSRAVGTLTWEGRTTAVDAACSLEYARARSPHRLRDRPVPAPLKLPWDFFCYQVLAPDDRSLLLLTRIGVAGRPAFGSVIRWRDGDRPTRWCRDVRFEVLDHEPKAPLSPSGARGPLARRIRWAWREGGQASSIELTSDGTRHPGVGTGWLGGWTFVGTDRGREVAGRAYGEFADRRA